MDMVYCPSSPISGVKFPTISTHLRQMTRECRVAAITFGASLVVAMCFAFFLAWIVDCNAPVELFGVRLHLQFRCVLWTVES